MSSLPIKPAKPGNYLGQCSVVGCKDTYITGAIQTDVAWDRNELRPPRFGDHQSANLFLHCGSHYEILRQALIELHFPEGSLTTIHREQLEGWDSIQRKAEEGRSRGFKR